MFTTLNFSLSESVRICREVSSEFYVEWEGTEAEDLKGPKKELWGNSNVVTKNEALKNSVRSKNRILATTINTLKGGSLLSINKTS